jgi:hypothetical protein
MGNVNGKMKPLAWKEKKFRLMALIFLGERD